MTFPEEISHAAYHDSKLAVRNSSDGTYIKLLYHRLRRSFNLQSGSPGYSRTNNDVNQIRVKLESRNDLLSELQAYSWSKPHDEP